MEEWRLGEKAGGTEAPWQKVWQAASRVVLAACGSLWESVGEGRQGAPGSPRGAPGREAPGGPRASREPQGAPGSPRGPPGSPREPQAGRLRARKFGSLWHPVAPCGALWRAVAPDWVPLNKECCIRECCSLEAWSAAAWRNGMVWGGCYMQLVGLVGIGCWPCSHTLDAQRGRRIIIYP